MADCLSCAKYTVCDLDKIALCAGAGCDDYASIFGKKKKNVCKYCGEHYKKSNMKDVCETCAHKTALLPRFAKARDDLREWCGLERMGGNG